LAESVSFGGALVQVLVEEVAPSVFGGLIAAVSEERQGIDERGDPDECEAWKAYLG